MQGEGAEAVLVPRRSLWRLPAGRRDLLQRMSELALCCPRGLGATLWLGGKPETA